MKLVILLLLFACSITEAQTAKRPAIAYVRRGTEIRLIEPDGSGLFYSTVTLMRDSANIFRYDFATRKTMQVTKLENEFARSFSISPDGKWIVFERAATADKDQEADLWIVGTDGRNPHLLVRNGFEPSW